MSKHAEEWHANAIDLAGSTPSPAAGRMPGTWFELSQLQVAGYARARLRQSFWQALMSMFVPTITVANTANIGPRRAAAAAAIVRPAVPAAFR
jgi:hypothetical protein